jgi:homoserine dehydrogenase
MTKSISVGLLGLGTVGSGVVKIIENHQDKLSHQVGCPVEVKKVVVKDIDKKRDV